MPLYIDLHIDNSLTSEAVSKCHIADKKIQDQYGVRYLQVLLNEPQGHLFCLVEGPDKETCAKVHQLAHGNIACNLLEITQSDFSALLSNKGKDGHDFTLNKDGSVDTGIRVVMALNLLGSPNHLKQSRDLVKKLIQQSEGRSSDSIGDQMAVFDSCTSALDTAVLIRTKIIESLFPVELRFGLEIGMPLGENGNFFEAARQGASHFAFIADTNQICTSSKVWELYKGNEEAVKPLAKIIESSDQRFLNQLFQNTEKVWNDGDLTITDFAHQMGLSKSQLTRKLKGISTLSPNDYIREFRLRKSIALIEDKNMNVAEISMAVGFSNAAYFAKCFRERFGKVPSHYDLTA